MSTQRAVRVYVAGPLSVGDTTDNVITAIEAGTRCLDAGLAPFVPHLNHFWHEVMPRGYEEWMRLDFEWLGACDVLLRLPGESPGAEREVALANKLGLPVYYDIDYMLEELGNAYVEVQA